MFDLPSIELYEKKEYLFFRKSLFRFGYSMIQFSVYVKCINTVTKIDQEVAKIKKILPSQGNVRMISVTEKQYLNMFVLLGNKKVDEIYNNSERYIKI